MRISLDGAWRGEGFSPDGRTINFEGQVPGCVHTDMWNAGKIPEPFWRDNAKDCRWIENWNWAYSREFELECAPEDACLEFEGLDTYCRVYLNGLQIGEADDMFIPHEFPAKGLRVGKNEVRVVFISPIAMTAGLPPRAGAFTTERMYTRRMQCTYFWDWVDRFVTMGIFRSVSLHAAEGREIADLRAETAAVDDFGALIKCGIEFIGEDEDAFCEIALEAPDGGIVWRKQRRIVEDAISEMIDVDAPELWWPNGYGGQPLYTLTARVIKDGVCVNEKALRIGIRTIRILQKRDLPGTEYYEKCLELKNGPHVSGGNAFWDRNEPEEFSGFIVIVNGVMVFCKGANWVPCEPFPSAETPEKIEKLITMARDAHINMIRVWGGGIFEQDAFYDACDRHGILVTQDFLMACGSYPEHDDWFLDKLRLEAAHAAKKLRSRTCLAWWTGDNENGMNGDEDMPDYGGRRSALRAIGPVLSQYDPGRPFLPSSPYGGRPYGSITKGTTHNTNYIGEMFSYIRFNAMDDYRRYFDCYLSRFCAEGPVMGAPSVTSLRKFMTDEDIFGADEAMMRFHTKNNPAPAFAEFQIYDYLRAIAEKLLGEGACAADRIAKLEYIQYEWIRITMELYRREKWFSSGMVYWMLNDCWPANGWAIIDYYARPKAAWYGMRRSCAPVIAAISEKDGKYRLHVCADGHGTRSGIARLFIQPFDSEKPLWEKRTAFEVSGNESTVILEADAPAYSNAIMMAEIWSEDFADRTWFFEKRPCDCAFPAVVPEIVEAAADSVTVRADKYIHALVLDGEFDFEDNYFSMLPGEVRKVAIRRTGEGPLSVRALNSDADTITIDI